MAIALSGLVDPRLLAGFLVYPMQVARIALREGWLSMDSWRFALLITVAKFAEAFGIIRFYLLLLFRSRSGIIEYK